MGDYKQVGELILCELIFIDNLQKLFYYAINENKKLRGGERMSFVEMIPVIIGVIVIFWCIRGIIKIFIENYKYWTEIENENYQCGKGMNKKELEDEIKILKNTETKPGWKLETASKIRGLEKALKKQNFEN